MEKQLETRRFLGLPRRASREELETRCEELLEWLESGGIPENMRSWASSQATIVREIYESLTPSEGEIEGETEDFGGVALSIERKTDVREKSKPILSRIGSSPITFVAVGVLLGLAAIGGLWWKGVIFKGEGQPAVQTPQDQGTFQAEQYLKSREGRIKELEKTLAANPTDPNALFEIGEIYMTGNSWENAILWFTKLLKVEPTNLHALTDVGTATMYLGRYTEAVAAFAQVLVMDPADIQAHYNMGFLYAFRTDAPDPDQALKHWQEVIRLSPDSELAKVAQVHIDQFKPSEPTPTGK